MLNKETSIINKKIILIILFILVCFSNMNYSYGSMSLNSPEARTLPKATSDYDYKSNILKQMPEQNGITMASQIPKNPFGIYNENLYGVRSTPGQKSNLSGDLEYKYNSLYDGNQNIDERIQLALTQRQESSIREEQMRKEREERLKQKELEAEQRKELYDNEIREKQKVNRSKREDETRKHAIIIQDLQLRLTQNQAFQQEQIFIENQILPPQLSDQQNNRDELNLSDLNKSQTETSNQRQTENSNSGELKQFQFDEQNINQQLNNQQALQIQNNLQQQNQQINDLKQTLAQQTPQIQSTLQKQIEETNRQLEQIQSDLQTKIEDNLQQQSQELVSIQQTLAQQIENNLLQQNQQANNQLGQIENNLQTKIEENLNQKANDLQSQIQNNLQQQNQQANNQLEEIQNNLQQQSQELANFKQQNQQTNRQQLEQIQSNLQTKIEGNLNQKANDLQSQIENNLQQQSQELANFKQQNQQANRQQLEQIENNLQTKIEENLNQKANDLQSQLQNNLLQQNQQTSNQQLEEIKNDLQNQIKNDLQNQIKNDLQNQIQNNLQTTIEGNLNQKAKVLEQQIQNNLQQQIQQINDLKQTLAQQTLQIQGDSEQQNEVATLKDNIEQLSKQLETMQDNLQQLTELTTQQKEELTPLRTNIEELQQNNNIQQIYHLKASDILFINNISKLAYVYSHNLENILDLFINNDTSKGRFSINTPLNNLDLDFAFGQITNNSININQQYITLPQNVNNVDKYNCSSYSKYVYLTVRYYFSDAISGVGILGYQNINFIFDQTDNIRNTNNLLLHGGYLQVKITDISDKQLKIFNGTILKIGYVGSNNLNNMLNLSYPNNNQQHSNLYNTNFKLHDNASFTNYMIFLYGKQSFKITNLLKIEPNILLSNTKIHLNNAFIYNNKNSEQNIQINNSNKLFTNLICKFGIDFRFLLHKILYVSNLEAVISVNMDVPLLNQMNLNYITKNIEEASFHKTNNKYSLFKSEVSASLIFKIFDTVELSCGGNLGVNNRLFDYGVRANLNITF